MCNVRAPHKAATIKWKIQCQHRRIGSTWLNCPISGFSNKFSGFFKKFIEKTEFGNKFQNFKISHRFQFIFHITNFENDSNYKFAILSIFDFFFFYFLFIERNESNWIQSIYIIIIFCLFHLNSFESPWHFGFHFKKYCLISQLSFKNKYVQKSTFHLTKLITNTN